MKQILEAAQKGDPAFYKVNLPIPFVLEHEGITLSAKGDKLACPCPFHDDSDPSLDVWQESEAGWRWGCYPCGIGGDVLDLIGRLRAVSGFGAQVAEAEKVYGEMPAGWTPPFVTPRSALWEPEAARAVVDTAAVEDDKSLRVFLEAKGLDSALDIEDLRHGWGVGCRGSEIVIPYYNREGTLVAYKHRTADTKAIAASGSTLRGVLYGEWRDQDPTLPVVLCEGESDTWAAASVLGTGFSVLGLPTGAGSHPVSAPSLAGRRVLLAFDGDTAGREATRRWAQALLAEGCVVEFVPVPDGDDLAGIASRPGGTEALSALFAPSSVRSLKPEPEGIRELGDTYVRPGQDQNVMLTNWRLDPEVELVTDEGMTAYEGTLRPSGRRVTLASYDLSSKARIVSWCSRYGVSWLGSDRDAQVLLAFLQHRGPFLPAGQMVQVAGLHTDAFVWPGGRAGQSTLVYSPPQFDVHLEQRLSLTDCEWTAAQIPVLRELHQREVMDPILGWLAAAPLRSLLPSFPTLAVTGSSGSGKTTLLSTVLSAFSGADISTNLTSTTKHALAAFLASTNAFPVWFDEYRPGARKDTQLALEQLIRDAYTGQISAKGGLGEHWSEISAMHTDAPIIVSGEDTFTETSHTERMVNLPLPSKGKRPKILKDVQCWGPTGLPLAYLNWLSRNLKAGQLSLSPLPAGPETLPSRQRDNLGTVLWGWNLLDLFCQEHNLPGLGTLDLSLVQSAGQEAAAHNPIKDALLWALEEPDAYSFVRFDPESNEVLVRVTNFVAFIERAGTFQLPGRAAAVKRYLLDTFDGYEREASFGQRQSAVVACRNLLD